MDGNVDPEAEMSGQAGGLHVNQHGAEDGVQGQN